MEYRKLGSSNIEISQFVLGTWAFGSDAWWGPQEDTASEEVLTSAVEHGITTWDTAPVYGKGHSEELIGAFLEKNPVRNQVVLASKLGLSWNLLGRIDHDLRTERMFKEIEDSRRRLKTDVIDLYQVHWPDPKVPMREVAETMYSFYRQNLIRSIGVSNFSVSQMQEFLRFSPIHCLQAPYNMFQRDIEKEIIPFCREKNIGLIVYIPLCSGILTGKFFCGEPIPQDICRRKHRELQRGRFHINKQIVSQLQGIARSYQKSLAQLVLCWTAQQEGITGVIVGCRSKRQLSENLGGFGWAVSPDDRGAIDRILRERDQEIVQQTKIR